MELISVIVPIFNAEKYLNRCIASIANQTYKNIEIILINDGSNDKSSEICELWAKKDSRVRALSQDNSGVSVARNSGVDNACGKYIIMVDSDDYLYEGMIEILYKALKKNNADMSVCDFEKGKEENYTFCGETDADTEVIDGVTAITRVYTDSHNALRYVAPWAKLYNRELFDGIHYPDGKIFEDIYVTHLILYKCKKIAVVPQKLTYYFQHPDSIMNKKYHVGKLDYLEACKNRIEFFSRKGLDELASIAYDDYLHSLIWEYSRAKELLADKKVMKEISMRFKEVYRKGYASKRYPGDTARFLRAFYINPELIIWYWKISSKLKRKNNGKKISQHNNALL